MNHLLLLLIFFLSPLLLGAATAEYVLDIDGDPLRNGGAYRIYTNSHGYIGYATLSVATFVVESFGARKIPEPVRVSQKTKEAFINASTDVQLDFGPNSPICQDQSCTWQIVMTRSGFDVALYDFVEEQNTKFQIVKGLSFDYYYLFFCPDPEVKWNCGYLSSHRENRVLGLLGVPLGVSFVLADTTIINPDIAQVV